MVTVCADWKMRNTSGCQLGVLILAGIPVYMKNKAVEDDAQEL